MERDIYVGAVILLAYMILFKIEWYKGRDKVNLGKHIIDRYRRKK